MTMFRTLLVALVVALVTLVTTSTASAKTLAEINDCMIAGRTIDKVSAEEARHKPVGFMATIYGQRVAFQQGDSYWRRCASDVSKVITVATSTTPVPAAARATGTVAELIRERDFYRSEVERLSPKVMHPVTESDGRITITTWQETAESAEKTLHATQYDLSQALRERAFLAFTSTVFVILTALLGGLLYTKRERKRVDIGR